MVVSWWFHSESGMGHILAEIVSLEWELSFSRYKEATEENLPFKQVASAWCSEHVVWLLVLRDGVRTSQWSSSYPLASCAVTGRDSSPSVHLPGPYGVPGRGSTPLTHPTQACLCGLGDQEAARWGIHSAGQQHAGGPAHFKSGEAALYHRQWHP